MESYVVNYGFIKALYVVDKYARELNTKNANF